MEYQSVKDDNPTKIVAPDARMQEASLWLFAHRDECTGRIIPTLKQRFGLSTCDAISAAQLAHDLQYGEVRHG